MVRCGPSTATGGMTTLTREPSGRRASAVGLSESRRRAKRADDPSDDAHQVFVILKSHIGFKQFARNVR